MIMADSLKRETVGRKAESGSAQSDELLMEITVFQRHRNGKERSAELSGTALGSGSWPGFVPVVVRLLGQVSGGPPPACPECRLFGEISSPSSRGMKSGLP